MPLSIEGHAGAHPTVLPPERFPHAVNLTLYLMRHGQTAPETPWRYLGQRDVALSDEGRAQALRWRDMLSDVDFAGAWSSDLARCRETAALVLEGRNLKATSMAGLREISLGEWDGLGVEDVKRLYPGHYEARGADIAGFSPPGGESFADLSERAWNALEVVLDAARTGRAGHACGSGNPPAVEAGSNVLVVAHAGVNRVLMCRMLGIPLENLFSLGQDHGCLNILRLGRGRPLVQALNLRSGRAFPAAIR